MEWLRFGGGGGCLHDANPHRGVGMPGKKVVLMCRRGNSNCCSSRQMRHDERRSLTRAERDSPATTKIFFGQSASCFVCYSYCHRGGGASAAGESGCRRESAACMTHQSRAATQQVLQQLSATQCNCTGHYYCNSSSVTASCGDHGSVHNSFTRDDDDAPKAEPNSVSLSKPA